MSEAQSSFRESRLDEIRREASQFGTVQQAGIRAAGSPLPKASPQTGYYQQHLLKEPQWTPLVPLYFFVGGASGSLGVIGSLADLIGENDDLARKARHMATAGSTISSVLLIADLGRPSRFLNMLRIFKPQSVMSVGSWVLSGFSAFAAASTLADILDTQIDGSPIATFLRTIGRTGCTVLGMPFHNYTGVLIGATAIPVWNNRVRSLPREFGMSGLQSAVSLLELSGETDSNALNAIGLVAAAFETWEGIELLRTRDRELAPTKQGLTGALIQTAGVLSGPLPIALRLASLFTSRRRRRLRQAAALSGIIGSLCLRYGWVAAGTVSARDWRIPLNIPEPDASTSFDRRAADSLTRRTP
ncbi:NrfD/PsrC family molybdoenzyme membrane anchor subunit [Occallatibacter savannae]|uniref:NrfD/PsrC family molybdoenzyme membrane anchor subunit n=1 Tax=Occallatibacter savannae TaxID=1002691 RepID=UPI000D687D82|nr:NrfD/PsrC family molybdoenzyme membrane anchor subunit [Occallatibacter savannae]